MGLNIDYMREFVVLAKNLNFSVTAEQLYVTQPSLTRHIAQIEEELGVQLLYRTTHDVALSEAGKIAAKRFSAIIATYDQLVDETAALSKGFHGNLRIGVPYYAIDRYIIPIVNYLKETRPEVKVDIYTYQLKQIIPELLTDAIDIGLIYEAPYANSSFVNFYPFAREKYAAAISVENPLSKQDTVSLEEIASARFVRIEDHEWLNNYIDQQLKKKGLELKDVIHTPQIDTLKIDLIKEKGVSIVESHLSILSGKELVFQDLPELDYYLKMCFTTAVKNDNPLVKSIIDELREKDLFQYKSK